MTISGSPPGDPVETGTLPMLANGHITFGYFGNVTKVTDHVVGVWSTLLQKVPGATLFLKSGQFDDAHVRDSFVRRFAMRGVPSLQAGAFGSRLCPSVAGLPTAPVPRGNSER